MKSHGRPGLDRLSGGVLAYYHMVLGFNPSAVDRENVDDTT